ncbi:transposase, partial [Staphylococcus aureus]|nr:transposase [Staphylococcus aureus]
GDTIAIEDLTGIRSRTTKRGKEARHLHNLWPYHLFRTFLTYKAERKGIRVVAVNPRDTSKTCSRCGHCSKGNRKTQAVFRCETCG